MKFKQWALGVSVAAMLGLGWACTDDDAPDNLAPGFSSYQIDDIKRTSAKVSATLTGSVNLVKEYGFQYSTSSEFPTDKTTTVKVGDGQPTGSFTANLPELERNETYYYRVYATTGATTVYSKYETFRTPSSSKPDLTDTQIVAMGENSATISFKLVDIGDECLIECGVGYVKGTTSTSYTPVVATLEDSIYVVVITDLEANTTYSFRPYAKNASTADGSEGVLEGYGTVVSAKTDELMAPEVITEMESSAGISSITVSGLIESAVGSDGVVFDCGFVWSSESQKPRLELNHESVSMQAPEDFDDNFVATITGLMANTTYYVCAYARNEVNGELKVGYGDVISVTTGSLMKPNINIDSYETTASSIILQATITNYDKGALKEKGFIYDRSSEIELEDAKKNGTVINTLTGANVFTDTIPGLPMNTSYFVRAYAVYEAEGVEPVIGYSGSYNITTSDYQAPSIGVEANNITRNSVDLLGKMYGQGNGTITERGFVLITTDVTYEPTLKHKGVMKIVSDDSFASTVKNLNKETSYSYRSYVISKLEAKVDTVYSGGWNSFQTLGINSPAFNNVNIENAIYNAFDVTCGITDIGDGKLLEKGFIFKKNSNDFSVDADSVVVESENIDEFTVKISRAFEYDNWYYVSCYTKKDVDGVEIISRSGSSSVWIPAPTSPDFSSLELDSITYKSVNAKASISNAGDGTLLEKGFYWSKEGTDKRDSIIVESTNLEDFSALITGLNYDNYYHFGVYTKKDINGKIVINQSGWMQSWIWISGPSNTSFKSLDLGDATYNSFKATCGINSLGDGTLLEKGFYYVKDGKDYDTEKDSVIVESDSNDEYSVVIDKNLDFDCYYNVRAYTKMERDSAIIISTSEQRSVWIPNATGASFDELKLDSTTYHSVIATGGITALGDGTLLEKGFFWKKDNTDFSYDIDSLVVESDTFDSFSATIQGMESNSSYYVGAYAKMDINGKTVINRSGWSYVWTSSPLMPSFDYFDLNSDVYRTLNASVKLSNGDGEITEKGFCWRIVGDNDWDHPTLEKNDGSFVFEEEGDSIYVTLSDLEVGKEYYVRAYAKVKLANGERISYSGTHGRTISSANLPSFDYWSWSIPYEDKTRNSFKIKTALSSNGNGTISNRGFVLGELGEGSNNITDPTLDNYDVKCENLDETFEATITGLKHNTEYAVRAFVIANWEEEMDTVYSDRIENVWTNSVSLPTFKTITFSNQKLSEMTVATEFREMGEGTLKEKGFCWDRSTSDFTLETETTKKQVVTTDSLKLTLTDLEFNTRYYVRAYAKVDIDGIEYVSYSDQNNDRTSSYSYPSIESAEINSDLVTRNSAPMSCVLNNAGNGVIIEKGFVLSKCTTGNYEPTLDNCNLSFVADNEFTATATGLDWNTEYAVRAYVTSKWEETGLEQTEYSGWRTCFYTKDITNPTFSEMQVNGDSITYSTSLVSCGITSLGDGEFVEKGFIWTDCASYYWHQPTIDDYVGMKSVVSDSNDSYLLKMENLKPGQRYGVRAYVKFTVDGKEAYGYSSTSYFDTKSLSLSTWIEPSITTCDVKVEFADEAENVKNVVIYLTPADVDEQDMSKRTKYTLTKDETTYVFTGTLDELAQNTKYYIAVYYEYAGNMIHYTNYEFSTKRVPQSGDNVSPGKKEDE